MATKTKKTSDEYNDKYEALCYEDYRYKIEVILERLRRDVWRGRVNADKYRRQLTKLVNEAVREADRKADHNSWL